MPSVSKKQHNLMAAVANNPAFAKKVGIKQSVGKEFTAADKGKTFKRSGGMANTSRMNRLEELGRVDSEKAKTAKGKSNLAAEKKRIVGEMKYAKGGMTESKGMVKKEVSFMKAKGAPKSMIKHEEGEMKAMKKGGMTASKMGAVRTAAPSRDGVAVKGKTKGRNLGNSGKNLGIQRGASRGR
jgi:hypothetical protein